MSKRAIDGINELYDRTAGSLEDITATITVDQVYAEIQHEALEFQHPRGGQAKYMTVPLLGRHVGWIQEFANHLLDSKETLGELWGEHVGEPMAESVQKYAPVLYNDLRQSAALEVTDGPDVVRYDPPAVPRLTENELAVKSNYIALNEPNGPSRD